MNNIIAKKGNNKFEKLKGTLSTLTVAEAGQTMTERFLADFYFEDREIFRRNSVFHQAHKI